MKMCDETIQILFVLTGVSHIRYNWFYEIRNGNPIDFQELDETRMSELEEGYDLRN